ISSSPRRRRSSRATPATTSRAASWAASSRKKKADSASGGRARSPPRRCSRARSTMTFVPSRRRRCARSGIDQHAGIEQALRIERRFRRLERRGKKRRSLAVVPGTVIAADGVVVRDCAARRDERVGGGGLDRLPLLQKRAVAAESVEREIGRGPVGIDVGEAAGDLARLARSIADGALRRRLY